MKLKIRWIALLPAILNENELKECLCPDATHGNVPGIKYVVFLNIVSNREVTHHENHSSTLSSSSLSSTSSEVSESSSELSAAVVQALYPHYTLLEELFHFLDQNNDGNISQDEFISKLPSSSVDMSSL